MSSGAAPAPGGGGGSLAAATPGNALLVTLAMAQFMVVLDFTIVNVALPSIQRGLHVPTTTLQWLVSGYAVAFGGSLLLGGRLADVFGKARLYRIGLCVFVVASVAGGLAVEPVLLITSRIVQGIGASLLAPAGLSLLVTSWPDEQGRSRALGVYGAVASTGFASGAALLAALFVLGLAARLSQVASALAGTRGPVAARSEGTASALLTATRQCGSALGVAIVSATLVVMHGTWAHRTALALLVAAGFALLGLLASRVVPPGPPRPESPRREHLFHRHAGGLL